MHLPSHTQQWQANPNVMVQPLGESTVLVHMGTDGIFELSATAARFWALLESGLTLIESKAALLEEFEVADDVLERELERTLTTFLDKNLVVPRAG